MLKRIILVILILSVVAGLFGSYTGVFLMAYIFSMFFAGEGSVMRQDVIDFNKKMFQEVADRLHRLQVDENYIFLSAVILTATIFSALVYSVGRFFDWREAVVKRSTQIKIREDKQGD